MNKITVIYHSADYDGIFCREIARKFLGDQDVQYIGWNFGDEPILIKETGDGRFAGTVYIMDLPPTCVAGLGETYTEKIFDDPVVWIDHHKSSIETWPKEIPGYRIDGVAACRLAWQWFTDACKDHPSHCHPGKQDFIDRKVSEPLAVRLAGEYDVWDKRDPRAEAFQFALRTFAPIAWQRLLSMADEEQGHTELMADDGRALQHYQQIIDADLVTHRSFRLKWEGLDWLCLNTGRFDSLTFAALDKPETGHDALLGFMWNGKVWTVSLYHAKHCTDLDLSAIAVKYGGGGHKGACGFTCNSLPFGF